MRRLAKPLMGFTSSAGSNPALSARFVLLSSNILRCLILRLSSWGSHPADPRIVPELCQIAGPSSYRFGIVPRLCQLPQGPRGAPSPPSMPCHEGDRGRIGPELTNLGQLDQGPQNSPTTKTPFSRAAPSTVAAGSLSAAAFGDAAFEKGALVVKPLGGLCGA